MFSTLLYYIAFIVLIIVPYRLNQVDRRALPEPVSKVGGGGGEGGGGGMAPPRTSTEEVIVDLCAKLVGAPQVGIITYFSLYSVNIQCEVFAILTFNVWRGRRMRPLSLVSPSAVSLP